MKHYSTFVKAIDPMDNKLKTFCGPVIRALNRNIAHEFCQKNGLGYLEISDEIVSEGRIVNGKIEEYRFDLENLN